MVKVILWCMFSNELLTDGYESDEALKEMAARVRSGEAKPVFLCELGDDGLLEQRMDSVTMTREATFEEVPRFGDSVTPCSVLSEDDRYDDSGFYNDARVIEVQWGLDGIPTVCLSDVDMSYAYGTRRDHVDVWEMLREDGWRPIDTKEISKIAED